MRWDLVIFDCDGVLIDSELLSVRAGRECLAECGIELTEAELLERYTGISWAGMVADLATRHGPLPAISTIATAALAAVRAGVPHPRHHAVLGRWLPDLRRLSGRPER
jgi:beta-phosphoglucomutase-like phosphatase (HAD superfamily)